MQSVPERVEQDTSLEARVRRIESGVSMLVYLVLCHTAYWPVAWALSSITNNDLLSVTPLVWAAPVSGVIALGIWRLVFPVENQPNGTTLKVKQPSIN